MSDNDNDAVGSDADDEFWEDDSNTSAHGHNAGGEDGEDGGEDGVCLKSNGECALRNDTNQVDGAATGKRNREYDDVNHESDSDDNEETLSQMAVRNMNEIPKSAAKKTKSGAVMKERQPTLHQHIATSKGAGAKAAVHKEGDAENKKQKEVGAVHNATTTPDRRGGDEMIAPSMHPLDFELIPDDIVTRTEGDSMLTVEGPRRGGKYAIPYAVIERAHRYVWPVKSANASGRVQDHYAPAVIIIRVRFTDSEETDVYWLTRDGGDNLETRAMTRCLKSAQISEVKKAIAHTNPKSMCLYSENTPSSRTLKPGDLGWKRLDKPTGRKAPKDAARAKSKVVTSAPLEQDNEDDDDDMLAEVERELEAQSAGQDAAPAVSKKRPASRPNNGGVARGKTAVNNGASIKPLWAGADPKAKEAADVEAAKRQSLQDMHMCKQGTSIGASTSADNGALVDTSIRVKLCSIPVTANDFLSFRLSADKESLDVFRTGEK